MSRAFVFLAFVLVLIAQAKAFMLAPRGSVVGAAAAITAGPGSSFTGLTVCERQATSGHGTLRMMRHRKGFKKLNLPADQRKALLRGLTTQLIRYGKIETTMARAKAMRKPVDHMITLSKNGTLHARRQALGYIYDKQLVHALFEFGADRYRGRPGGYTRIHHREPRKGDNTKMAIIELV